jgi:hypothetical protein
VVVFTELIVVAVCAYSILAPGSVLRMWMGPLSTAGYVLWAVAALVVSVRSASAFGSERANQTLDVLLASPVPTEDLVRQKLRGVRRLIRVLCIPFVTVFLFKSFALAMRAAWGDPGWGLLLVSTIFYLALLVGAVFLFLSLVSWVSAWIGMKAKTQYRAIATTLVVLVLWNGGTVFVSRWILMIVMGFFWPLGFAGGLIAFAMNAFSPASMIAMTDYVPYVFAEQGEFVAPLLVACAIGYGGHYWLLRGIRRRCLTRADVYLGRAREWFRPPRSVYLPPSWSTQWD